MADLNNLFERFPDYNNFTGETETSTAEQAFEPDTRAPNDYGDGFGQADRPVKVRNNNGKNFLSILFFPILILWSELFLRLACNEGFNIISFLYTLGFTLPIAAVLTLLCTFFSGGFNRVLCNIFAFIITLFYIIEICYYYNCGSFLSFSFTALLAFEKILNAIIDKGLYCAAIIIPFVINLLFGHKIFGFKKFRIPAKLTVIVIAIIIQIAVIGAVNLTKDIDPSSRNIYYGSVPSTAVQERFGLLTMERLSIFKG